MLRTAAVVGAGYLSARVGFNWNKRNVMERVRWLVPVSAYGCMGLFMVGRSEWEGPILRSKSKSETHFLY